MKKGQKMSEEQKEKIRQSNLGKKHNISKEGYEKLSHTFLKGGWNKGLKSSKEWREKVRQARLGTTIPVKTKAKMKLSAKVAEENHKWLGDDVSYTGLHMWVKNHLGKPKKCEHCGRTDLPLRKYHWANIDHKYRRNLHDWLRLCVDCHRKYDKNLRLSQIG